MSGLNGSFVEENKNLDNSSNKSPSIQRIDRKSVHRICSGQVVLNLATAVKELVENSVDAGATIIEVKLKEYGSESIEVIDNGSGIEVDNFESIALKHYTSKIKEFTDLLSVQTYGFRGEALSSLCALSELSVTTRHLSLPGGTRLEFNSDGKLISQSTCARQIGTTILIQHLFHSLPVRLKQFHQHIHKEYTKMMQVLQGYCVILSNVKVVCSNTTSNGRKSVVLSTIGSSEPIENFCNIFGSKQTKTLQIIKQIVPTVDEIEEFGLSKVSLELMESFQLEGHISSCKHGAGRSSPDRQYMYVNKRPCDWTKLTRVINDVYHQFNRNQYPSFILNINTAKDSVDVNLTPDKRSVLMHQEKVILVVVKSSLKAMFQMDSCNYDTFIPNQIQLINDAISHEIDEKQSTDYQLMNENQKETNLIPSSPLVSDKSDFSSFAKFHSKYSKHVSHSSSSFKQKTLFATNGFIRTVIKSKDSCKQDNLPQSPSLNNDPSKEESICDTNKDSSSSAAVMNQGTDNASNFEYYSEKDSQIKFVAVESISAGTSVIDKENFNEVSIQSDDEYVISSSSSQCIEMNDSHDSVIVDVSCDVAIKDADDTVEMKATTLVDELQTEVIYEDLTIIEPAHKHYKIDEESISSVRPSVEIAVNIDEIKQNSQHQNKEQVEQLIADHNLYLAKISPDQNSDAEKELNKHITKEMFKQMKIIGQFNKGFIITQLNNDLFIIDQHATDEKYNFEKLQLNEKLSGQKLIQPRQLELTASNEDILISNLTIFQQNGFDFKIDEDGPIGKRIYLISLPTSKNWTFSVDDIEELIFQLSDSPGTMCRPSRVRQMFASRACRKSVMIGTVLSQSQMKTIVEHMSDLEHPWNCPHGRPTMRHLISLKRL